MPVKYFKHLEGSSGLYEIRVEVGSDIYRVFCFFDKYNWLFWQTAFKETGEYILIDALKKCYDASLSHIGAMAVIVDPLDAEAEAFYVKYDFIKLDSGKMFLTMQTIAGLF